MDWLSRGLDGLLQLWERGKALLWALAAICAAVLAILFVGAFLGVATATVALQSYGLLLVIGAAGLGILAAVKIIASRYRPPSVHLIANNAQSLWGQSRQQDGRITTQLSFRFQAANPADNFIRLSAVRLSKPWTRAPVLANVLLTSNPNPKINTFSQANPIAPRAISEVSGVLVFDKAIGRPGKPMTAVIKVSDQFGRWHKVKFRLVDPRGSNV